MTRIGTDHQVEVCLGGMHHPMSMREMIMKRGRRLGGNVIRAWPLLWRGCISMT